MSQSSGDHNADKHARSWSQDVPRGALTATFVGTALVVLGGYVASQALLGLSWGALAAIVAVIVGSSLLITAVLVATIAPAADSAQTWSLSSVLESAARGDLTRDVRSPETNTTLAPALRSASRALTFLRAKLTSVRAEAQETSVRAEELVGQCAAGHVAAQRAAEQGAHVAQQSAVLDEELRSLRPEFDAFSKSVLQVASIAQRERDLATKARNAGREVTNDLEAALKSLEQLESRVSGSGSELSQLSEAVDEVAEFVTLVRKMARQSKLLSLNAAMEAARAGEQGSGFGVVAAEVRRLARSSSDAADRTEALLRDIIGRSGEARASAQESGTIARTARDAVERASEALGRSRAVGSEQGEGREFADAPGAAAALAKRFDQMLVNAQGLAAAARDAKLAGSAQVARAQDLAAAAHTLSRSASRGVEAFSEMQLDIAAPAADAEGTPRLAIPVPTIA